MIVSSLSDCSECYTIHPLTDMFILTPSRLTMEALSHKATTAQRPHHYIDELTMAV